MADSGDLPFSRPSDQWEEPQLQLPDPDSDSSIAVTSISPAASVSLHDRHWGDFSIDDNSTTVTAESLSGLSLGRDAPTFSPSILVADGVMPSTSSGKGLSSSSEVPTTDHLVYCTEELHLYLDIAAQCLVHVQEMPMRKFNTEQCGYLIGKLKVILQSANLFLEPNLEAQPKVKLRTSEDMTRCTEVFKLLFALALKIESFIQDCCKDDWIQAGMTLTNTAEYVSSLGFNLELCRVYFSVGWAGTNTLTADEVDSIDRNEVETVKTKARQDERVFHDKVILELPSLQAEAKDLAIYLVQRLNRVKPVSTSLPQESPFGSAFDDLGFQGRIFQMVRQTELLGKGTSATVHKALWLGTPVAKKTFYGPEHPDYLREAQILGGLCHPNIMSMFCCAMDKRKCSIVMELMDEDLHSLMQRRLDANPHSPPFSVFEAVDMILQIGEGVHYLHKNGIVHRDLKSLNILVKNILPTEVEVQYVLIKVADFGLAKIKESSITYSNQSFNIGTHRWMPPEVIKFRNNDVQTSTSVLEDMPKYPKKSDVYSFGMVCYEILTGDVPFPEETLPNNIKRKVLKGERPTLPEYCPSKLKDLIEECWDPEPTKRPSFASMCLALKHLKCLLMSGFNSNEDSCIVIGETLQMSRENILSKAPPREMVLQKEPIQGGLVKSWFTVLGRPLRIFISHASGPNGTGKRFPVLLHEKMKLHWSRSRFRVKPFIDADIRFGVSIISNVLLKELARFDVGIVVVTESYFTSHWCMTELIEFVEAQKDRERRIHILPLFYQLTPEGVKQGLDQQAWEDCWGGLLQLEECRNAVWWLCMQRGISYFYESLGYENLYIEEILEAVDKILREERSIAAELRRVMSLLQRNRTK